MLPLIVKTMAVCLLGLFLSSLPAVCKAEPTIHEHVAALIEQGLQNNSELAALRKEIKALEAEAPAAGAFTDPKISFGVLNVPTDTFDFDQEAMTQKQVALSQRLKWFGKLSLAQKKVVLRAERQRAALHGKELELARDIAVSYHDLGTTYENLETNATLHEILGAILRVAESRYATGIGGQQDILQAQVEMNQTLDDRIVLERTLRQQKDRINELVQRERFVEVPAHAPPELVRPSLSREQLVALALENNAAIKVRQAEIDIAEVDVKIARKEFMPDVDVSLAYGQRDDDPMGNDRADFLSAGISFTIPLWAPVKQEKTLEGAQTRVESTQHSLQSVRTALPHKIDSILTEINSLLENQKLMQNVLTLQASQWAESLLAKYEVGEADFDTTLAAELRLVRYNLKLRTYRHQIRAAIARLEELVGAPVPLETVDAVADKKPTNESLQYKLAIGL